MDDAFVGPPIDDFDIFSRLPSKIGEALKTKNGYVLGDFALHIRGACNEPLWHSLRYAWDGPHSLHELYPSIQATDIPLAEDCFGDQYLLRDDRVVHLLGESGEVEFLGMEWDEFIAHAETNPGKFFGLQELQRFHREGGTLAPGQSLSVYPPFIAKSETPRSLRAISSSERILWLADFARQIRSIPDGTPVEIRVVRA
jgi:hypothetical protein